MESPTSNHRDELWQRAEIILRERFGHAKLTASQRRVIDQLFLGNNALAVMPTGSGKSLCYQLPSQVLPGLTVVVSPLVSLMKDQCDSLRANGIAAERLDQTLSPLRYRETLQAIAGGSTHLLYVAPERFFNERFPAQLAGKSISLLAIDEAHCMSQWGHQFRPDYLRIPEIVETHQVPQVIALTATASPQVVKDIRSSFNIKAPQTIRVNKPRRNLQLIVTPTDSKQRDDILLKRLKTGRENATIVYVTRRQTAQTVAEALTEAGLQAKAYHAGLTSDERQEIQNEFVRSDRMILVGTVAFGMGVDKSNVRRVIHYNHSGSIEAYTQEIGRGGRDGKKCLCETLYVAEDAVTLANFAASDLPSRTSLAALLERLQGQPEHFHLALGKLAWEVNLDTAAVATFLLRLQEMGYLSCEATRYESYTLTPRIDLSKAIEASSAEQRVAVEAIVASLSKGKRGHRFNPVLASDRYGVCREDLVLAIETMARKGAWNVSVTQASHTYRWLRRPTRVGALIKSLLKTADAQHARHLNSLEEMKVFLETRDCLTQFVTRHFGGRASKPCGKCSSCLNEPFADESSRPDALRDPSESEQLKRDPSAMSIGTSALSALQPALKSHPDLFSDPLDQAKFLCGLSTPLMRRYRLNRQDGFGVCDHIAFGRVYEAVQAQALQNEAIKKAT